MKSKSHRLPALFVASFLGLVAWIKPLSAISVETPTFTDLVDRAEQIVEGTVAEIQTKWVDNAAGHRVIKTFVRIRVSETAKGTAEEEITLLFFGGTLDGQTMAIAGMPEFRKGQRGWFFITGNGRVICPLIYAHHGAYLITSSANSSAPSMSRLNGSPLHSLSEIGAPDSAHASGTEPSTSSPLTPADFSAAVVREFDRLRSTEAILP
jgi:hypothetical protein